jgi:GxxExxY protein
MPIEELIEERLTYSVIGAFFEVYNTRGFGFLEHLYTRAMEHELVAREHRGEREVRVPVWYKGARLATQRLDMLVDQRLVVEAKATYELQRAAPRQLHNYLRATRLEVACFCTLARSRSSIAWCASVKPGRTLIHGHPPDRGPSDLPGFTRTTNRVLPTSPAGSAVAATVRGPEMRRGILAACTMRPAWPCSRRAA